MQVVKSEEAGRLLRLLVLNMRRRMRPLALRIALFAIFIYASHRMCSHVELLSLSYSPLRGYTASRVHWERFSPVSLLARKQRSGTGVMLFAYGNDEKSFANFKEQAYEAGRLFKQVSPDLKLALVTSHREDNDIFDYQIVVRQDHNFAGSNYQERTDGLKRQWLTRILYLTATPFEVTLAYDANVVPCGNILPAVRAVASSDFDIAVASQGDTAADISPHNFAIAYKWNREVSLFFNSWFMTQVIAGVALDDQHTLQQAVVITKEWFPTFKFRTVNPSIAGAFVSSDASKGFFPRETRVITGDALLVHADPRHAAFECTRFNAIRERRQIIFDGKKTHVVLNGRECSLKNNGTPCKYDDLWRDEHATLLIPPNPVAMS